MDRATLKKAVEDSGAEVHLGHDQLHELFAVLAERHHFTDLFWGHLAVGAMVAQSFVLDSACGDDALADGGAGLGAGGPMSSSGLSRGRRYADRFDPSAAR